MLGSFYIYRINERTLTCVHQQLACKKLKEIKLTPHFVNIANKVGGICNTRDFYNLHCCLSA